MWLSYFNTYNPVSEFHRTSKTWNFPLKSELRNLPQDEIDQRVANAARILHIENLLDRGTTNFKWW